LSDLSESASFPEKLEPLFLPARYKVLYGGRGGAKSWGVARALLIEGACRPLRVLCARETQKSIAESVHQLLKDQVSALGLENVYTVQETMIFAPNGTQFSFAGLRQQNITTIKSYEGVDICWVEEAQVVTKKSWDVLIPTIRKPKSEIWITFNPDLDTDETYKRFVADPPDGAIVIEIGFDDNPWFPEVLRAEMLDLYRRDPAEAEVVWGGKCRPAVQGAIYLHEMRKIAEEKRLCNVPYDPMLKVHRVWDLGWNDSMAIALVQKVRSEIRIIDYIEDSHRTLDDYVADLKGRRLNWGMDFLPHDGDQRDYKSGKSAKEILSALGCTVQIVPNMSIEGGIKVARMALGRTYFDKKATGLVDRLKRYRRVVNASTNEPGSPLHDESSHGADCYRYLSIIADRLTNENLNDAKAIKYPKLGII
jgi:phage terminase large subunit